MLKVENITKAPIISSEKSFDPAQYLRLALKHRWAILGFLLMSMMGAGFYTLKQRRIYQSVISVIIDFNTPRILENQVGEIMENSTTGSNYWANKEYNETQIRIIMSRSVATRTVERLGLSNDAAFLGLDGIGDPAERVKAIRAADAAEVLRRKIKVLPIKDSRLVQIFVEDTDATRAALLANEVANSYVAENLALKLRITENASHWLEERLESLQGKTKQSEMAVYDFKKDADMLTASLEDKANMVSQKLIATNSALTEVRTKIAGLKAKVGTIEQIRKSAAEGDDAWAESLSQTNDNFVLSQTKIRYAEQKSLCAELQEHYLGEHPKTIACVSKLRSIKADLLHDLKNIVLGDENDLSEAVAREKNLVALFNEAKSEAFQLNKKQIEYERLKRESDNNQRLYDMVLKRLKDIELSGLMRTSNVRVLDAALANPIPVRPNVINNMIFALLFGLAGGVGLAFILDRMDDTIASQEDVDSRLGVAFLGIVPTIPDDKTAQPDSRDLHIYHKPKSTAAECCRAIRTNLLFMSPDKPFKTLLVSSNGPQEGKSTSVMNIGIAMAQSGKPVLLVDTDMRRPRLHRAFKVPNDIGVSSLVVGEGSMAQAIKSTEVPNLFLLPCGPIPPNPSELLHTHAFKDLLEKLCEKFDRVILDSPPIGAVVDALVLATQVDGVVMVLKAGKTSREASRRAIRSLYDVKAKILGVVLNNVDFSDPKYGKYSSYQYYSYYGEKKDEITST